MPEKRVNVVGSYEARTHFSELVEQVEQGAEVVITRHGRPVARLVPARTGSSREERERAIRRWRKTSRGITLGEWKLRDLIEAGRS